MNTTERQQSLVNARRACELLEQYLQHAWARRAKNPHAEFQEPPAQDLSAIACLLAEFRRLDANARRPRAGRKRIKNPKPTTLAQRRWRDKKKNGGKK